MPRRNIIIVGNGLFGSIAATLARAEGHAVTVVANAEPLAASKASGCVLAPSWLSSLPAGHTAAAMEVLRGLYAVEDLVFQTNLMKSFKAQRVDPAAILVEPDVVDKVTELTDTGVKLASGARLRGRTLVAAGIWSSALVRMPTVRGLFGASVKFQRKQLETPKIHVYAPYRQAVAFNLDRRTVWVGDGTALVEKSWELSAKERVAATLSRAQELFALQGPHTVNIGARPYVEGHKAGYFAQVGLNAWVSTGGAKNGTALAAWQALRFIKEAL